LENPLQCVRIERSLIVRAKVAIHIVFALGFVDGKVHLLLDLSDFLDDPCAPVQRCEQLAIDRIDLIAKLRESRQRIFLRHPSIPLRSDRANASRSPFCSIVRTNALPTATPSASCATSRACSGVEIPNPTASGSMVCLRVWFTNGPMES